MQGIWSLWKLIKPSALCAVPAAFAPQAPEGNALDGAELGMPPAPLLLPGQKQQEEFGPDMSQAAVGLPGPLAVASAPLPLARRTDQGQLCPGTGLAPPLHLLAFQPSQGVQCGGLDEERASEEHLQPTQTPRE